MKKLREIISVALAACALFSVSALSACSSSSSTITLDSYWYINNIPGIQATALYTKEVLEYDIFFDEDDASNDTYRVIYDSTEENSENFFRTTFMATTFDWSQTHEKYILSSSDAEDMTESDKARLELRDENGIGIGEYGTVETVYVLETEMNVTGRYIFNADNTTIEFENYIYTTTYFRSARNSLEPVYSKQEIMSTSPLKLSPLSANEMCETYRYDYEVFYDFDCTEATYIYTEYEIKEDGSTAALEPVEATVDKLDDTNYTLFDNNSVYTAIRGMSLSSSFSAVISLFIPAGGGIVNCSVSCGTEGELDPVEDDDIITALTDAYDEPENIREEDEESDESGSGIYYNPVSLVRTDDMHGGTQTIWYAAVEDESNNQYRATMLYLCNPLSYGLGNLEYRLKSVEEVFYY